jgi:hypothetical protein
MIRPRYLVVVVDPEHLAHRYRREGYWTKAGALVRVTQLDPKLDATVIDRHVGLVVHSYRAKIGNRVIHH